MHRSSLLLFPLTLASLVGSLSAQAPDFGDVAVRDAGRKSSIAATGALTPAVTVRYAERFEYVVRLAVKGTPAALHDIASVTYAVGTAGEGLRAPYGKTATLVDLAQAQGYYVTQVKAPGKVEGGSAFAVELRRLERTTLLYIEAVSRDGQTRLVGNGPWLLDQSTVVPQFAGTALEVTPRYVKDPPQAGRLARAFGRGEPPLDVLRGLRLSLIADPKVPSADASRLRSRVAKVEYCAGHTMDAFGPDHPVVFKTAALDESGSFSIELADREETRRYGPLRTNWTVCVAVTDKDGRVATFWARRSACLSSADGADDSRVGTRSERRPDLAYRIFLESGDLPLRLR